MARRHSRVAASAPAYDRYLDCPNGSHLAMYDDQKTYMDGVIGFIKDVDAGTF